MRYFDTLPKIVVTQNNVSKLYTNLLARSNIIQSLINDPLLYYSYDIKDSDTPEIIAHKYYNDINRFWIVLFANQIFDPQWEWPLTNVVFNQYLLNKYTETQLGEAHHYEKIIEQTDVSTNTVTKNTIIIDENTYNTVVTGISTYTLPTGVVSLKTSVRAVDYYTYELELNESKRNIQLLNKDYVNEFEVELRKLMN